MKIMAERLMSYRILPIKIYEGSERNPPDPLSNLIYYLRSCNTP